MRWNSACEPTSGYPQIRIFSWQFRMTNGYVTAPQCVPSRAGILTGRYQNRFGVESNGRGPLPLTETTIADRMSDAGYTTGMVGKWHLAPNHTDIDWIRQHVGGVTPENARTQFSRIGVKKTAPYRAGNRGFAEFYEGPFRRYFSNYDLSGQSLRLTGEDVLHRNGFRVDIQSDAAVAFINRNHTSPFFLYLAYFAPHVPLEATEKYLQRFPENMPRRRRLALAMLSAVDDGVGRVMETLRRHEIEENTLIFVIGDNGAPLKIHKADTPGDGPGWDGSLNDPFNGEKGMLTEGGIRVPFIARWKGTLPEGVQFHKPVISLDVAATSIALAGQSEDPQLDGVNLIPFLTGKRADAPHRTLYWRWVDQAAIRSGRWKYLRGGNREYLFDLFKDKEEQHNVISKHRDTAKLLSKKLLVWCQELKPAGFSTATLSPDSKAFFDYYLDDLSP
ncbi:MAG TPA: hypothetical protein EYQ63_14685 [Fuerstia sp.]|nr:hypothetical protein [Fuerstiella sp.]